MSGTDIGSLEIASSHRIGNVHYDKLRYHLVRCASCGRGGLAAFHVGGSGGKVLFAFYPSVITAARIPEDVPNGVQAEFREAELCASSGAHRAASAMVRSVLEKALRANGYDKGSLKDKIDQAAADGVITEPRKRRAHDEVRVLGNEVVHDEWREISLEEVESALHYAQRILEDLYDDRDEVEKILAAKGRMKSE